ncbi:MAG: redox-sensing transcriptional repressor Rex [Bacilli bacterium]|nr:redox-sensing transcriptional repressor Rex [Bacilli bacterium]
MNQYIFIDFVSDCAYRHISTKILIMSKVSPRQLERYPVYLKLLLFLRSSGVAFVSAPYIAKELSFSEEQVRKDLQLVTRTSGKPRAGRDVEELIADIQEFLHYKSLTKAAIAGVGHLGKALMNYRGFRDFGLEIVCGFDEDPSLIGTSIAETPIYAPEQIAEKMKELQIDILILAVPSSSAQQVADAFIRAGIKGIWNFAPTHIKAPEGIPIENVNLASSFAVLRHQLKN